VAVNLPTPATSNVLQLRLSTRELAYDPVRDVLYASTPASNRLGGNLIAVINPVNGVLERALPAGSEPEQLAISDDAQFLYTSLNGAMGAKRFALANGSADVEFQFSTNDMNFAYDLEVRPGNPAKVAVSLGSFNMASPYPSTVMLYDGGVQLTNQNGTARGLTFSADGNALFGYYSPGTSYGFVRMAVGEYGLVSSELVSGFSSMPGDLKFSNGRLYSSSGQVVEPYAPFPIGGFSASGPHTVDADVGRAYYLTQAGSNWELRAFDVATLTAIGTQVVANVQGTPSSLIRCGADRLAFRTSSGQVFIVRGAIVSTNRLPAADLAVSQQAVQDFSAPVETLRFTITVTNQGSGNVSNALLAIRPPTPVAALSLKQSQGNSTNSGGNFLCNLGALAAGQTAVATLTVNITNSLTFSNFVSASAEAPDPVSGNNVSVTSFNGWFFPPTDSVRGVALATRDLSYDAIRRRVVASVSGTNQLAWLNPETTTLEGTVDIGGIPDRLAISDDSQYLYVSFLNTSLVQRVQLATRTVDLTFTLPAPYAPMAFVALPGQPRALVLSYSTTSNTVTTIFDDDAQRTNQVLEHGFRMLAGSSEGQFVYGYDNGSTGGNSPDVFRLAVSSNGLAAVDNGPSDTPWGNNDDWQFYNGRLYFANGNVLNLATWTEEEVYPPLDWGQQVEINGPAARAIFLMPWGAQFSLYDLPSRQLLSRFAIRNVINASSLTQCGADRLACRSGDTVYFVRSSAIPSADLVLRAVLPTNQVMVGETLSLQLTVSNTGPYAVSGVSLTNTLPAGFDLVSLTISQGTATTNGQNLIFALGDLATNDTASVSLSLSPTSGPGTATNIAVVFGASLPDAILSNNRSVEAIQVLPKDSDHDGLPDDWELAYGLDPTNAADAAFDSDCDGLSNIQEYQAGTNPLRFEEVRLHSVRLTAPGSLEAEIVAALGKIYALEGSTNLADWSSLSTFVCRQPNQLIHASVAPSATKYFLRLQTDTNAPLPLLTLINSPLTNLPLIRITAPPGHYYSLQASSNLLNWTTISNYFGTDCSTAILDPAGLASLRFYRVLLP